jgi:phenylpropionate dioxygenase-like ring-hydroxylating dioxygenase large terminal subunit
VDAEETRRVIARLIERAAAGSLDLAPDPAAEATADFLDPARFERERQQFFLDTPQVLGFAGEVQAPGSYLTAESLGIPIVVTRTVDGELRAFVNACAHRGAQVAKGHGTGQRLTCGFHGWTYSLDGQLVGRRADECFEPAGAGGALVRLPVSDRSGLVVVGLHPEVPQATVDDHLAEIEGQFVGFGFPALHPLEVRRFEVAANWKLIAALSYESYHFLTLHRDTVGTMFRGDSVADTFGTRHSRWAFALKGTEKLAEVDPSKWPDQVPGAINHCLFPGTVVITSPGGAQIIRSEPGPTVGQSVVHYHGAFADLDQRDAAQAAYDYGGHAFEHEDLVAAVECQRGLAASGRTIQIGRNEPMVQFWHRVWREQLDEGPR